MVWLIMEAVITTIYGVHRATKQREKEKHLPAKPQNSNAHERRENKESDRIPSHTSYAKNKNNVESGDVSSDEDVDGGDWSKPSIKFATLSKDVGYKRVNADTEERTSTEYQNSNLKVSGHDEVFEASKDDKELRLRISASVKEAPEESDITTETHFKKQHLFSDSTMPFRIQTFWSRLTLRHAVMCMKAVTSLIFITIFFSYFSS